MRRSTLKRIALVLALALVAVALVSLLFDPSAPRGDAVGAQPRPVAAREPVVGAESLAAVAEEPAAEERHGIANEAARSRAVLRLLSPTGEPVTSVSIGALRNGEVLFLRVTDAAGEVELDADGGAAQVFAHGGGWPIAHWTVRLDPGAHALRFPVRGRVAGRVVDANGVPVAGLRIDLRASAPMLPEEPIPAKMWEALGMQPQWATALRVDTDREGGFEFRSLPSDWSGFLRFPRGWNVLAAGLGEVGMGARAVVLDGPVEGFVVRVERPAMITGRLLSARDRAPIAGTQLAARLSGANEDTRVGLKTTTDDGGRFEFVAEFRPIQRVELWIGDSTSTRPPLLDLETPALPTDGALGDVLADGLRDLSFLLRGSEGAPISGGHATAAGLRSPATDATGRGLLRWVPLDAPRLRADAPGRVPAEVELGPRLPDPIVLVLVPATELELRVLAPAGGDPSQFRVLLRCEEDLFAGPLDRRGSTQERTDAWAMPPADLMQAPQASYVNTKPSREDGLVHVHALAPGVPIDLEVRGITGPAVYLRRALAPFAPGEHRALELDLTHSVVVFRGRVLDDAGAPLGHAAVQLGGQILGWSDDAGEFLVFLADGSPETLVLQHQRASPLFLHDFVPPGDGRSLEFRLPPARAIVIEVVDVDGRPVEGAEVWIRQEGFTSNTHPQDGHRHLATSLTDGTFVIEVRVGGRVFRQAHTAEVPEARVVVPAHGSVRVHVPESTTAGRAGSFSVMLMQPVDDVSAVVGRDAPSDPSGVEIELPFVFTGRHRAWLYYTPSAAEAAAGATKASAGPFDVDVEPDRRTELELALE